MNSSIPQKKPSNLNARRIIVLLWVLLAAAPMGALFLCRAFGLIRPFKIPTGAMAPAISAGDHVFMEGLTYRKRPPRRGDIVVFKADYNQWGIQPGTILCKRVAGEPGEHVRLRDGHVYINDAQVTISNAYGEIKYVSLPGTLWTNGTVPAGEYFVMGDNSANSLDSRYYGTVAKEKILGRMVFCYWPPNRRGTIK